MGRTVINETENKQTVILNDSPAGVEGGYYNALMEWHELKDTSGSEAVYVGKTLKIRSDWTPVVSSSYDVLPIFGQRVDSGVSSGRTYVVYVQAYSTGRLAVEQVNKNLTNPVALEDLINANGEITSLGESIRLYLSIGVPAVAKELIDKVFIEA